MKKRFKRVMFLLLLVSCGICGMVLFFNYIKKGKINSLSLEENGSERIYIPVTINNRVSSFLFDTGSSHNLIDFGLAQEMELSDNGTFSKNISGFSKKIRYDSVAYAFNEISIGNLNTKDTLLLNQYKGLFLDSIGLKNGIGATLGMKTIKNFNWLFNFEENTVTVSKRKITPPTISDDQILTLDFFYSKAGSTYMNLSIGGVTLQNVVFDTGYGEIPFQFAGGREKKIDLAFSNADCELFLSNHKQTYIAIPSNNLEGARAIILDSMLINDFTMQGILALERNDYDQTYITANFVRRFRMMYFDSTNRKIELYVSPSDSMRHHRRDIQMFIRALSQHGDDGGGTEIPSSIIDLW